MQRRSIITILAVDILDLPFQTTRGNNDPETAVDVDVIVRCHELAQRRPRRQGMLILKASINSDKVILIRELPRLKAWRTRHHRRYRPATGVHMHEIRVCVIETEWWYAYGETLVLVLRGGYRGGGNDDFWEIHEF